MKVLFASTLTVGAILSVFQPAALTQAAVAQAASAGSTPAQSATGLPFTATVTGHGRPVILIPGLSSPGETYDGTVAYLSPNYQCHVLTLAGFAGVPSQPGEADGKMLIHVEDALATYIREHSLDHPVLIGHSLGGFLAVEFAERYPELAGDLVIVDALPFTAGVMLGVPSAEAAQKPADQMRRAIADEPQDRYDAYVKSGASTRGMVASDADFQKLVRWGLASDKRVVGEAMYELLASDARPQLGKIPGRVLVLGTWAGYPGATSEAVKQTFAEQYRGTQHLTIVMAGEEHHFIMLDNPTWFDKQLEAFLGAGQHASR
jgi:pimeloyl-ACP methyl ester carboxylesterase